MAKIWRYYPSDESDCCGSSVEIFTEEENEEGYGYDQDEVKCVECGALGQLVVIAEDEVYLSWDED